MEKLMFQIPAVKNTPELLNMGGRDLAGNLYQADQKSLLVNGKRIIPVMGEIHFSRLKPEEWKEAILKMRAGGVNIAATYVFWNHHEERQGEWDFSGCRDLRKFLDVCRALDMKVWLRIGPWAHGECRHGGFPDYVQYADDFEKRTDDPKYLALVETLYTKIGEQSRGMMCKEGGPVIGIQLENEYGHCGGPNDKAEQARHMKTLLHLAKKAGLDTPYYTATAWGGACTIDETLQVLSGYVDAPWDNSTKELPAMENFLFIPYRDDDNTGSDFHKADEKTGTIRRDYPYLTAELGGGLQVTSHRRPVSKAIDNAGHIICVLGAGANLIGYYMYHGGINPDGKYSDLNEAQSIGGNTTVPRKSYDFDACINEAGKINESFGVLKKYHLLLSSFESEIAEAETVLPASVPESAEDMKTIRAALRWNYTSKTGFLFVNNHVRNRLMEEHPDVNIYIHLPDGTQFSVEHLHFAADRCYVIPIELKMSDIIIKKTNCSLLCRLGKRVFLYSDEKPHIEAMPCNDWVTVLTESEADRGFLFSDGLYVVEREDSCIIEEDGTKKLITQEKQEIKIYHEDGTVKKFMAGPSESALLSVCRMRAEFELTGEERDKNGNIKYRSYQINLEHLSSELVNQIYLNVHFLGDRAEVYDGERLIDDWFNTGKPWNIPLRRFHYPAMLKIRIYDSAHTIPCCFGQDVYYDLSVEAGCEITGVELIPEYSVIIGN